MHHALHVALQISPALEMSVEHGDTPLVFNELVRYGKAAMGKF